jgi:hypothetical protein
VAPSVEYGTRYVELTAHYSDLFHRGIRLPVRGEWEGHASVSWRRGAERGVRVPSMGDGLVEPAEIDGVACLKTVRNPDSPIKYFYAEVDDSFAFDTAGPRFTIAVKLLVEKESAVTVEYDSNDPAGSVYQGAFKAAPALGPFPAGKWHTVTFELPDARFVNRANGGDFRLSAGGNDLAVAEVGIAKM